MSLEKNKPTIPNLTSESQASEVIPLELLTSLGSLKNALEVFQSMHLKSQAYRNLLIPLDLLTKRTEEPPTEEENLTPSQSERQDALLFRKLPILTKKNFYGMASWKELLTDRDQRDIFSFYRSSGSTQSQNGDKGFFWPLSRSSERASLPIIQKMLTEAFSLDKKRTLVIVGLSLGSWAGGEQFSFLFKNLAFMTDLDLVFFAPGNQHHEIIEVIEKFGVDFEQILCVMCPSAIFYFHCLAEKNQVKLPLKKLTYIVTGETFPEQQRLDLKKYLGQSRADLTMLSIYGSADTGFLGFESLPLIRLRQFLHQNPEAAKSLGFSEGPIPNLFHAMVQDAYFENIEGELVVTKSQGIPLVRYNLQDRVQFFSWKKTCNTLAKMDPKRHSVWTHFSQLDLPDIMSVGGRTTGCLIWGESKIYEETLCEIFHRSQVGKISTGLFIVWLQVDEGQQRLHWQIELQEGIPQPNPSETRNLIDDLIQHLVESHSEFREDYLNVYQPLRQADIQVFNFHFCVSPYLKENPDLNKSIKKRVRINRGPL